MINQSNLYYFARKRKWNVEGTSEEVLLLEQMFPASPNQVGNFNILLALKKYFDKEKHMELLIQRLFKNHNNSTRLIYQKFMNEHCPGVTQPIFSTLIRSDLFISLDQLREWIQTNLNENYPSFPKATIPEQIYTVLDQVYDQLNYVPNLQRYLFYYPDYLWKFNTYRRSIFSPSKIDTKMAYLLVLFVAFQFGCAYMISRACAGFLVHGGPRAWILENKFPKNITFLFNFIRKACKTPWQICTNDYKFLKEHNWETFDLLHHQHIILWAITSCTMSLAMGLVPDEKCQLIDVESIMNIKKKYDEIEYEPMAEKQKVLEQIHEKMKQSQSIDSKTLKQLENKQVEQYMKSIRQEMQDQSIYQQIHSFSKGIYTQKFIKSQKKNDHDSPVRDFDDSYFGQNIGPQLSYFLGENIGQNFQSLVKFAIRTNYTDLGCKKTDPKQFLQYIRYYAQNLLGVTHRDFDYKKYVKMNPDISMGLRFYIRLLVLHPIFIKKQVLQGVFGEIKTPEQVFNLGHLALVCAETKAKIISIDMYNHLYSINYEKGNLY